MTTEPGTPPPNPATGVDIGSGGVGSGGVGTGPSGDGLLAASARLAELPGLPVTDHVAVFEDVHRLLAGTLAELDAADGPEAPAGGRAPGGAAPARTAAGAPASPRPGPSASQPRAPWAGGGPRPGAPRPGPGGPR